MGWLAFGLIYTALYFVAGSYLAQTGTLFAWFRLGALLVPPLAGVLVIARQRARWSGCQWLFWATNALGLATVAIGHVGWFFDSLLLNRQTPWLGWYAVFVLFGTAAPLLALLAQPHRGVREKAAATVAVDIAGIAVVIGFLYSYVVTAEDVAAGAIQAKASTLLILAELQPLVVFVGMGVAALLARRETWGPTYRRLALGLAINFVTLTLSTLGILQGLYRPGFVYDFMWILPFTFYPWAASSAPSSEETTPEDEALAPEPSRPWLILAVLVLIPALDYALRGTLPGVALAGSRDLATAVTVVSVLPLLLARLAVERSQLRHIDDRLRLLAAAVEQADERILIRTIDRRFVYANEAFCRALGYSRSELAAEDPHNLFDPESAATSEAVIEECRRGRPWRGPLTRRRRDGTTFPAEIAVVPFGDARGRTTHLLSVEHDVTVETQLREQLIHSERLSAVGQLVSGVAHELNNPLQSVVGFAELLLDKERREGARQDLEQIKCEAMRAARTVRNLLSFVRRAPAGRKRESVNEIVQAALALRSYELSTANVTIEEDYANDLPPVWVNREEIQQVLLNLLLNAEQAMLNHRGRGTLRVRTSAADGHVHVEVADDGPGVPPDLTGRIFEPFFSTKEVGEGTGLGLSIALGIATSHGGSLELAPSESGARFVLRLPISASSPGAAPRQEAELAV